ncbi:DUF2442 domain-containing protein [Persicitalea sp.]|uniref:DUF2442 domain-containing protein n=1 Tax=Persicitalea sp. TaxID=3100273 RepID=UPI0035945C49
MNVNKSHNAVELSFTENKMTVFLNEGRELSVLLEWFPNLRDARKEQLNNWRFIGNGEGIHWPKLDEDILVERLLY